MGFRVFAVLLAATFAAQLVVASSKGDIAALSDSSNSGELFGAQEGAGEDPDALLAREYYEKLLLTQAAHQAQARKAYTEAPGLSSGRRAAVDEVAAGERRKVGREGNAARKAGAAGFKSPTRNAVLSGRFSDDSAEGTLIQDQGEMSKLEGLTGASTLGMASGAMAGVKMSTNAANAARGTQKGQARTEVVVTNAAEATVDSAARSLSAVNRFFNWLEGNSDRYMSDAPLNCPPEGQQKHALTALLLAILVPPACQFYYGYIALGSVQLVLYILCLTPLCFACGWFFRPTPKKAANMTLLDSWQPTIDHVSTASRWLFALLVISCVIFVVLLIWQVTLIVRVSTGAFMPADGCPVTPL
jgi:hypothetical protein